MASSNETNKPQRKRFVAGAVCPKCGAEDKIFTVGDGLDMQRCCNQCGFSERLGDVPDADESVVKIQLD